MVRQTSRAVPGVDLERLRDIVNGNGRLVYTTEVHKALQSFGMNRSMLKETLLCLRREHFVKSERDTRPGFNYWHDHYHTPVTLHCGERSDPTSTVVGSQPCRNSNSYRQLC